MSGSKVWKATTGAALSPSSSRWSRATFGATIYAEYRMVPDSPFAAKLDWDPDHHPGVAVHPEALRHRYSEVEIKAHDVAHLGTSGAPPWRPPCTPST